MSFFNKIFGSTENTKESKESKESKEVEKVEVKENNLTEKNVFENFEECEVSKVDDETKKRREEELQKLPRWKKVTGYKAFTSNMSSFYGKMTYEVGKEYKIDTPIMPCENGFHFCLTLDEVMTLFPPIYGRRYFKVEAEIPVTYFYSTKDKADGEWKEFIKSCGQLRYEKDYIKWYRETKVEQSGLSTYHGQPSRNEYCYCQLDEKYVGRSITVLEEVPFSEIQNKALNIVIRNEEDYKAVINKNNLLKKIKENWLEKTQNIFSEAFANYLLDLAMKPKVSTTTFMGVNSNVNDDTYEILINQYESLVKTLYAIKDEKVSQDIRVWFMSEKVKG